MRFFLAMVIACATHSLASAGWLALHNDTNQVLVVQEVQSQDPTKRLGQPQRLYPGEWSRSALHGATTSKSLVIFQADHPQHPLYQGTVAIHGDEAQFSIRRNAGKLDVVPKAR